MPDSARRVFSPERLPLAEAYAGLLADAGTVRGLIGPREVPRLWERHLLNCAAVAEEIPDGATVVDLGSGAGLPGLVLAIVRPDLQVTLVEPLLRRTTFLDEAVAELGLTEVEVVRGRAEDLRGTRRFDIVTSRALAPLERLLGWSMPLVAPRGALLAMKGTSVAQEIETARLVWESWGCAEPTVVLVGADVLDSATTLLRVAWADPEQIHCDPAPSAGTARRVSSRKSGRDRRRG